MTYVMWPVHVGFVVDKVVMGRVLLRVLRFLPVSFVPPILYTQFSSIYHRHYTNKALQIGFSK
jgi:hypothetical protein